MRRTFFQCGECGAACARCVGKSTLRNLIVGSFIVFSQVSSSLGVPTEWRVEDGGNGHYYEVVSAGRPITWSEANTEALNLDRHLASITSQAESDFIFSLVDDPSFFVQFSGGAAFAGPWLGGIQAPGSQEPDGGWGWTTGEPFSFTNWLVPFEPNDSPSNEDRIHYESFSPTGDTWNDLQGTAAIPTAYVLEWEDTLRWHGDQAGCDGIFTKPVGSFFDPAMWRQPHPTSEDIAVFEAISTFDVPNPSTSNSEPRTVHFGDTDLAANAGCLPEAHIFHEGGGANVAALEVRNSVWTFNFGIFDNYFGIGDFVSVDDGSLTVAGRTEINGRLTLRNGTMTSGDVLIEKSDAVSTAVSKVSRKAELYIAPDAVLVADQVVVGEGGTLAGTSLVGNGTIIGDVIVRGGSIGLYLDIEGDLVIPEDEELRIGVSGPQELASTFASVSGEIVADGVVAVEFENGFAPSMGDTITLIDGWDADAPLPEVELKNLAEDFIFALESTGGKLVIEAQNDGVFQLKGDVNNDFVVDGEDFLLWQREQDTPIELTEWSANYGASAININGDFDFDGDFDGDDFLKWQREDNTPEGLAAWQLNYSQGSQSSLIASQTVPEPDASGLLAVFAFLSASRQKRQNSGF